MKKTLDELYLERLPILKRLARRLETETRKCLKNTPHVDRISFRAKTPQSFLQKANNEKKTYKQPLIDIEDQVAGRVIVFFVEDILLVAEQLRSTFVTLEEEAKKPATDDAFGYESHHFTFALPPIDLPAGWKELKKKPAVFELQVRTLFMHAWAEPQHDIGYKDQGFLDAARENRRKLAHSAAMAWGADQAFQQLANRYILFRSKDGGNS